MSVWVSAIFSHNWQFSQKQIEEIAQVVSKNKSEIKWRNPSFGSPEEEFAADKTVQFLLPGDFTLKFGRKIICLEHADRWSRFLMNEQSRHHFLAACKSIAKMAGAKEILFVPEGTMLMDLYYSGCNFEDCMLKAKLNWGPPNLFIDRIYSQEEVSQNLGMRVNYFLVPADS